MADHIRILAILHIIFAILLIVVGIGLFFIIAGAGAISGDSEAMFITGTVGTFVAGFFIVLALPALIAGLGLRKRKQWARVLTIVLSVFNLFAFPIGTAIGIYALVILLNQESAPLFV